MPKYTIGFTYVMSNQAMPGMIKVGLTSKLAEDRARELYETGVPLPFDVEFCAATSFRKAVEAEVHRMLEAHRVSRGREFFRAPPYLAIDAIRDALLEVASIKAWDSDEPHPVSRGDRLALTTQADDIFVVLTYPQLFSKYAEPIDLWQAHSDGDLVELMGTASPAYVAGVSDYDRGSETDPVPYLDRGKTMPDGSVSHQLPNGLINGRERLVPGDRLLWFRPGAEGRSCQVAMFEICDYCQVTSRTWDLKFTPDGHPRVLNYLTSDEQPECVVRATRAALRIPRPRTWTPRNPAPDEGWLLAATDSAPPEYWLTQLAKKKRRRPPAEPPRAGG